RDLHARHYELKSDFGIGRCVSDDHRRELWRIARHEHGDVQRNRGNANELERDEHRCDGTDGSDNGERGGDGWRSGQQQQQFHRYGSSTEHYKSKSDVRSTGYFGDDHRRELWGHPRDEHREVQRDRGDADELERDEHRSAGASGSDNGKRSGNGWRSGEQWRELYRHVFRAEHHEPESDFGIGRSVGDDHGRELWRHARDEHSQVQRNRGDADELERDEHRSAGADGSDDGERGANGWRSGQQRSELHGYGSGAEHHESESDVRSARHFGDDHGRELWRHARDEHSQVQRDDGDADELERNEHRSAGADGSNDGERCGDG